jgi:hypothetical protein
MQFVFLLLFNLFLGAVLYLVISLKLERSATEYRSRKLRKEMDEMISEFNATAERNISLLERKIRVMRMLLEKAGDLKTIDLTTVGEDLDQAAGAVPVGKVEDAALVRSKETDRSAPEDYPGEDNNAVASIKKGLLLLTEKIRNKLLAGQSGEPVGDNPAWCAQDAGSGVFPEPAADSRHLIEKDLSGVTREEESVGDAPGDPLTEEEIFEIVSSSPDRYTVVAVLNGRGCAIEDISKYSGVPISEVRLVLNLNSSR